MTEMLSERERLIKEIFNKCDTERGTHREALERIVDFILADRARIVEPLVKFITERPRSLEAQKSYHFFIEMDRAIGETIKRANGGE